MLNVKYIKTKQNWKLEAKLFRLFQVLYPMGKQAYKLKLPNKLRIYNLFYILLLEQDITKNKELVNLSKLDAGNDDSKEYKLKAIWDSVVHTNKFKSDYLPALYYLVT